MKLLDILLEILRESKPITLDKSVVPQMEKVYNSFKKLENDEIVKWHFRKSDEPIKLSRIKFKNQYDPKFTGVTVFLSYVDNTEQRAAYFFEDAVIEINVNSDVGKNKSTFMNALYHELVHAIDPKLNKKNIRTSLLKNLDRRKDRDKSSVDYVKYMKNPAELDAFSSTFVNQIKDGLDLLPDSDKHKVKDALKILINNLLGLLKKYSTSNLNQEDFFNIIDEFGEFNIGRMRTIDTLIFNNSGDLVNDFIGGIIYYLNKPSLFKKYIQRLSTVL